MMTRVSIGRSREREDTRTGQPRSDSELSSASTGLGLGTRSGAAGDGDGRAGRLLLAGLYMTGTKVDDAEQAQWHAAAQCPTMVADRALR